jgi:hypothetical protein
MGTAEKLRRKVDDFVRRVRARPSESVGPELDSLQKAIWEGDEAAVSAYKSPIANVTWMQRAVLMRDQLSTPQIPMEIPYACRIVTCHPVLSLYEAPNAEAAIDYIEAPISAVDVVMQLNRLETFTARMDKLVGQNSDAMVCSLAAFDDRIRSFELELNADDNILAVQFKWATENLQDIIDFNWGSLRISLNWAVDPKLKIGDTQGRYGKNP